MTETLDWPADAGVALPVAGPTESQFDPTDVATDACQTMGAPVFTATDSGGAVPPAVVRNNKPEGSGSSAVIDPAGGTVNTTSKFCGLLMAPPEETATIP